MDRAVVLQPVSYTLLLYFNVGTDGKSWVKMDARVVLVVVCCIFIIFEHQVSVFSSTNSSHMDMFILTFIFH